MPARNTQAMQYDSVDASKTLVNRVSMKLVKIASTKMVDGDSPKNADGTRKSQPVTDSLAVPVMAIREPAPVKPRFAKVTPS